MQSLAKETQTAPRQTQHGPCLQQLQCILTMNNSARAGKLASWAERLGQPVAAVRAASTQRRQELARGELCFGQAVRPRITRRRLPIWVVREVREFWEQEARPSPRKADCRSYWVLLPSGVRVKEQHTVRYVQCSFTAVYQRYVREQQRLKQQHCLVQIARLNRRDDTSYNYCLCQTRDLRLIRLVQMIDKNLLLYHPDHWLL